MSIKRPDRQDMADIAEYYGMSISDSELAEYQQLLTDTLASFDRIDELEAPVLVSGYKRDKGSAADPEDNPPCRYSVSSRVRRTPASRAAATRLAPKAFGSS